MMGVILSKFKTITVICDVHYWLDLNIANIPISAVATVTKTSLSLKHCLN